MRFKLFMERWQGIFLILLGCVSSVWLAVTNQLNLYIHPRYIIFTAIMAAVGVIVGLLSFGRSSVMDETQPTATSLQKVSTSFIAILCVCALIGLLIVKPTTLTTSTVNQRGINNGIDTNAKPNNAVPLFGGGDYTSFTVKDWAALLRQSNDPSFFAGKTANVTGFISPDGDDPQNVFFVSRFIITCCAVDARAIGVPVYAPHWQADRQSDSWVTVQGTFISNPSAKSQQHVAIQPIKITNITQPNEPYLY